MMRDIGVKCWGLWVILIVENCRQTQKEYFLKDDLISTPVWRFSFCIITLSMRYPIIWQPFEFLSKLAAADFSSGDDLYGVFGRRNAPTGIFVEGKRFSPILF